jgi:hypothetical protein
VVSIEPEDRVFENEDEWAKRVFFVSPLLHPNKERVRSLIQKNALGENPVVPASAVVGNRNFIPPDSRFSLTFHRFN